MNQLPPVSKFELNRMIHARAQELYLLGSPPGHSGHRQLHHAAMVHFGVKSFGDLSVEQMRALYNYLDANKRLPLRGELK